jgi:hypothetical protein
MIAFVAADEDGNYFGYWRSPKKKLIAKSSLVRFDNEGQFSLCPGSTFAEAVLFERAYDAKRFTELRKWLLSLGIAIVWKTLDDATFPEGETDPNAMREKLYYQHLGKKPPRRS